MNEILGEYGSLIVEMISGTAILALMQRMLFPAFVEWITTFFNAIM